MQLQSLQISHTKKWDRTSQLGAGGDIIPVSQLGVALLSGSAVQLQENNSISGVSSHNNSFKNDDTEKERGKQRNQYAVRLFV